MRLPSSSEAFGRLSELGPPLDLVSPVYLYYLPTELGRGGPETVATTGPDVPTTHRFLGRPRTKDERRYMESVRSTRHKDSNLVGEGEEGGRWDSRQGATSSQATTAHTA